MEKEMKKRHYYSDVLKRFRKHKLAMIGLCVLLLEIILVVALPLVFKLDPYASDSSVRALSGPVSGHILGTDKVGRDNLARLVYGGRGALSGGGYRTDPFCIDESCDWDSSGDRGRLLPRLGRDNHYEIV